MESTVITADASATHLLKSETCNAAAKAASSACIALTKADVVPRDSASHIHALINKACVAYMTDLDAILVDSTSPDGARELMEYIGSQLTFVHHNDWANAMPSQCRRSRTRIL